MPSVTASSFVAKGAAGRPHGFGGDELDVLEPLEEDTYFKHTFTAIPVSEGLMYTEVITSTTVTNVTITTPGFELANTSFVSVSANGASQAIANGYFTGVFHKYFWRYHYSHELSANTSFYSDRAGYPEANTAQYPNLPPASSKPIVYWAKPDPRKHCTAAITVTVGYSDGFTGTAYTADFVFTEDVLNNWDVFRQKLIQLRTDGRLGTYNEGATWSKVEYPGLTTEFDSTDNVIEYGYTQVNMQISLSSISSIIQFGNIEVI